MFSDLEQRRRAVAERLRALPDDAAQPYDWTEFQKRARTRGALGVGGPAYTRRLAAGELRLMAGAAVVVLAVIAVWSRFTTPDIATISDGTEEWARGPDVVATGAEPGGVGVQTTVQGQQSLSGPMEGGRESAAQQRASEQWLARQPREPVVVRVGARAVVAGLEDQIAQLDDLMSAMGADGKQAAGLVALEQQRARLVSSLVQVRYAERLAAAAR